MADGSNIEWTDASWNPVRARNIATGKIGWHCEHVSEGCRHCYAEGFNKRLGTGLDFKPGHLKDVEIILDSIMLTQPLRWRRPRKIFVNSMTDLFADFVTDEMLDRIFAIMALSPQHTFQVLTKRPERMKAWFAERWQGTTATEVYGLTVPAGGETGRRHQVELACEEFVEQFGLADTSNDRLWTEDGSCRAMQWAWPLPNVWLGVSVEDQAAAGLRIPLLLETTAAVRFISAEPLIGPVDLVTAGGVPAISHHPDNRIVGDAGRTALGAIVRETISRLGGSTLDWVIVGGESGPGARPFSAEWARVIVNQCRSAGIPCFVKQMGSNARDGHDARVHLTDRKGGDMAEWPTDLRVREFPAVHHG